MILPKAICEAEGNFYKPQMIKYAKEKAKLSFYFLL